MHSCNSKITLIVAGAGYGTRMHLDYPKQFIEVNNKPLIIYPLEIAQKNDVIDKIIIVTTKEAVSSVANLCTNYKISKVADIVVGGTERQYSVENALKYCEDNSIIAVHDGVRPFLKDKYFYKSIEILENELEIDGVVIGVPLKDTIKNINSNGNVVSTPKRDEFILAHTPQIFRGKILKKAYEIAKKENFLGTDDSSLVERINGKIKILLGDYDNIKVTTIEDLDYIK